MSDGRVLSCGKVVGPKGDKGDAGAAGTPGAQGAKGDPGEISQAGLDAALEPISSQLAANTTEIETARGTYADLDARLKDIKDHVVYHNLVPNTAFADTTGWGSTGATRSVENGELILTGTGQYVNSTASLANLDALTLGEIYFVSFVVRAIDAGCNLFEILVFGGSGTQQSVTIKASPTAGSSYRVIYAFRVTNQTGNLGVFVRQNWTTAADNNGKRWALSKPNVINITDTYGAGRERTVAYMMTAIDDFANGLTDDTIVPLYYDTKGETIACFGDSVLTYGWPDTLRDICGANVLNLGIGSTTMVGTTTTYDKFSMVSLTDAYVSGNWTAQDTANAILNLSVYNTIKNLNLYNIRKLVISFGTNDWNKDIQVGTSTSDKSYFAGAVAYIITQLLTKFPALELYFISPMWRQRRAAGDGLESDANPNTNGDHLIDFADAILSVCAEKHIKALDMYRESGVNIHNYDTMLVDGLHPTVVMTGIIARKVQKFIA
jgi:lysophospholipase L1-like esterase